VSTGEPRANEAQRLRPSSSIEGDAWQGYLYAPAYEWWYFDAISDDGRDALVIIFLTNFVFSPRYNRAVAESLRSPGAAHSKSFVQFPAVAVCFYRDGRPLWRAINEYPPDDFQTSRTQPACRIGGNSFRLVRNGAETCYRLNIETRYRRKRNLRAWLEWRVEEGDFFAEETIGNAGAAAHHWNMVAPRCSVSGEIALTGGAGKSVFEHGFHGSGYHDHNRDARWMPATIAEWQWGRIHFPAATAVFYRYRERDESLHTTRLFLIQDGQLNVSTPQLIADDARRHLYGLRYPRRLQFQAATTDIGPTLRVRQQRVIDGSFFYLRFLSEATLRTIDGRTQHASAITEHLEPRSLRYPWLWWLINMRIGRNGRAAFLP
jgi:carotenoid 1,2-hydratase